MRGHLEHPHPGEWRRAHAVLVGWCEWANCPTVTAFQSRVPRETIEMSWPATSRRNAPVVHCSRGRRANGSNENTRMGIQVGDFVDLRVGQPGHCLRHQLGGARPGAVGVG